MLWPRKGLPVHLRRSAFVEPHRSRQPLPLVPGGRVVFACLAADDVAAWACPWEPPAETDDGEGLTVVVPDPAEDSQVPCRLVRLRGPVDVPPPNPFTPTVWTAPRPCILCRGVFLSAGPGMRMCPRCLPPPSLAEEPRSKTVEWLQDTLAAGYRG